MKQIIYLVFISCGLFFLFSCTILDTENTVEQTSSTTEDEGISPLKEALKEDYINEFAEEIIGPDSDNYILFVYSPYCTHCHEVLESDEYKSFVKNPMIKLYKISTSNKTDDFFNQLEIEFVPLMIFIEKISEYNYEVTRYGGNIECIELIKEYYQGEMIETNSTKK